MRPFLSLLIGICLIIGIFSALKTPFQPLALTVEVEPAPHLSLGVIPYLRMDDLQNEMNPVIKYLSKKLHRPTKLNVSADYGNLARLLDDRQVHLAWFSHASLQQLGIGKSWEVLCRPFQKGNVTYFGKIIARANSNIETIEDLKGKIFAYVDKNSGSGFYFPNMLFKSKGIDPLKLFSKVVFTHSHDVSIDGVLDGKYDGAAVFSLQLNARYDEIIKNIKFIATTGPIPNDPIVCRSDLPRELKAQILDALLKMHEDPDGMEEMAKLTKLRGTTRFAGEKEVETVLKHESLNASPSVDLNPTRPPITSE